MALFSYYGSAPAPLPEALIAAPIERLEALGYTGPFSLPSFTPQSQQAKWSGSQWEIINLSPEQIEEASIKRLLNRANWQGFSEALMATQVYTKARAAAAVSLQANVDATELIAFLADARAGRPFIQGINNIFASIEAGLSLTVEEKAELDTVIRNNGLDAFLTVPNYSANGGTQ